MTALPMPPPAPGARRKPDIYNWLDMIAGPIVGQIARGVGGSRDEEPIAPPYNPDLSINLPPPMGDITSINQPIGAPAPAGPSGDPVLDNGPSLADLGEPPPPPPGFPGPPPNAIGGPQAPPPTQQAAGPEAAPQAGPPAIIAPLANRRRMASRGMVGPRA